MEPQIQYVKTTDGVSIAYYAMGQGTPLVIMNLPNSHLQMEWQMSDVRQTYEAAARLGTLARYDPRGFGLSDRDVNDFSIEALLRDLQAVVDRLELKSFNLLSYGWSSPLAIAFAAAQPDRVLKLVLWPGYARLPETWTEAIGKMLALDISNWEFVTESLMRFGQGWSDEMSGPAAATLREAITPQTLSEWFRQAKDWDVRDLLAQVTSPTMLVQEKYDKHIDPQVARELATAMPDARLVILDAETRPGRLAQAVSALLPFLGGGSAVPEVQQPQTLPHDTAIILFTDIEGSTAMTQRLGDARDVLREHERIVREALKAHGGSEVKTIGDGFMASFGSATKALECAIALQRAFDDRNASLPAHPEALEGRAEHHAPIKVRIGLNAGEPIAEDEELFGTVVITAARIAAQAQGGEILVSDVVRQLVAGKGFLFADRGETVLRGFEDPVRVYEVRW